MALRKPAEEGLEFEEMMAAIDRRLIADGADIQSRPLMAVREVAIAYDLSIPLGGDAASLPADLRENLALGEAIKAWYDDSYGALLKVDPCPGRMVVLLDGDLHVLRVPRLMGETEFVVRREWIAEIGFGRGPSICNVVQLLQEMTPARAARLSDEAMNRLGPKFETAIIAAYTLEESHHRLIEIARGDVEVAISSLMARGGRVGESKWASLQAAEKVLKAAIDLSGANFKPTHNLASLCTALASTGLAFNADKQVAAIQCRPGIRYGEESCTREDALGAHHASLELVILLAKAGIRFSPRHAGT